MALLAKQQYKRMKTSYKLYMLSAYLSSLFPVGIVRLQFMTLDSIAGIYFPLIMAKPVLFFFFAPILWLMGVALMNLVAQQHISADCVDPCLDQGFWD